MYCPILNLFGFNWERQSLESLVRWHYSGISEVWSRSFCLAIELYLKNPLHGKLNPSILSVGYAWWLPCREYSRESGRNDGNFTVKKTWQLIPQPGNQGQYQQWWIILMVWTLDVMWTSPLWSSFRKPTTPV